MGHHIEPDGTVYADTAFINAAGRLPGVTLKHLGFGEFYLETPKGQVEFDRMRGKDFPGQSGRSHQVYDSNKSKGGPATDWVVAQVEAKKLSERMGSYTEKIASPPQLLAELQSILASTQAGQPSREDIARRLRNLADRVLS